MRRPTSVAAAAAAEAAADNTWGQLVETRRRSRVIMHNPSFVSTIIRPNQQFAKHVTRLSLKLTRRVSRQRPGCDIAVAVATASGPLPLPPLLSAIIKRFIKLPCHNGGFNIYMLTVA